MLADFRNDLLESLKKHFPSAKIEGRERRGAVYEARAHIGEATFIEIYYNAITEKKSFALISDDKRIAGYDNYKFWHFHPLDKPDEHIKCDEPSTDAAIATFRDAVKCR